MTFKKVIKALRVKNRLSLIKKICSTYEDLKEATKGACKIKADQIVIPWEPAKTRKGWQKKLAEHIYYWTGPMGMPQFYREDAAREIEKMGARIPSALKKAPHTLYRSIPIKEKGLFTKFKAKKPIKVKTMGYTSWSMNKIEAEMFFGTFEVPEGYTGLLLAKKFSPSQIILNVYSAISDLDIQDEEIESEVQSLQEVIVKVPETFEIKYDEIAEIYSENKNKWMTPDEYIKTEGGILLTKQEQEEKEQVLLEQQKMEKAWEDQLATVDEFLKFFRLKRQKMVGPDDEGSITISVDGSPENIEKATNAFNNAFHVFANMPHSDYIKLYKNELFFNISSEYAYNVKALEIFKNKLYKKFIREKLQDKRFIVKPSRVIDKKSNLMWIRKDLGKMTWDQAKQTATPFTLESYRNWRIPTEKDWASLKNVQGIFTKQRKEVFYWINKKDERLPDTHYTTKFPYTGTWVSDVAYLVLVREAA